MATLNTQLGETSLEPAYDFESRLPDNDDRLFIVLAFSGGGTRASALSYGVLNALRQEQITIDGKEHRLLDQVDVISAVSGGSYTAAYYGLFGDRLFEDFRERFLLRGDVEKMAGAFGPEALGGELLEQSEAYQQFLDSVAQLTNRETKTDTRP